MAGMEIFGWLSATIVLGCLIADKITGRKSESIWLTGDWGWVGLFVVIAVGAVFVAPPPPVGWGTDYIIGSARFVFLFLLLRLGLLWTWNEEGLKRWTTVLIIIGVIVAMYAIVQYYTGLDLIRTGKRAVSKWGQRADGSFYWRASGMFDHPLRYSYSVGMSLCFPLALALVAWTKGRTRVLMAIGAIIMAGGLFATLARGAWLAVFGAVVVMLFYSHWKRALTACVVAGSLVVGVFLMNPELIDRAKTVTDSSNESNSSRFDLWKANWQMFLDHPVLGVGYGQNEAIIGEYYQKMGYPETAFKGHAHNNYMQFLSGTGFLGLALYGFVIGFYLWLAHRTLRMAREKESWAYAFVLGALGAQIVLHLGGMTETTFKNAQINHFYMLILAVLGVVAVKSRDLRKD